MTCTSASKRRFSTTTAIKCDSRIRPIICWGPSSRSGCASFFGNTRATGEFLAPLSEPDANDDTSDCWVLALMAGDGGAAGNSVLC